MTLNYYPLVRSVRQLFIYYSLNIITHTFIIYHSLYKHLVPYIITHPSEASVSCLRHLSHPAAAAQKHATAASVYTGDSTAMMRRWDARVSEEVVLRLQSRDTMPTAQGGDVQVQGGERMVKGVQDVQKQGRRSSQVETNSLINRH